MDDTLPPKKPVWTAAPTTHAAGRPAGERSAATPEWVGQYQVVKKLGSGSMGDVYRCHDQALGREVAVKVLKAQYAVDEHYRRRFRREARAVASLSHPCVVQIFGIHEDSGPQDSAYIVMEFVDGCSADDFLAENGPVAVDLAARWVRDAASGLREAAAKDIIHRDVKPSNILVTPAGNAKIVDFGLAKELGAKNALTQEGIVLGTPHYISPEQGRGRPLDHRADIYSLGATFYHLLTGRPPFDGDSQIAVIVAHVNESPVAPHLERPEVPESVTRVVFRMMAKSPDDRYGGYDELIEDLDALLAGRDPPHAVGTGVPPAPASSFSRRRLKLVAPLVAALFIGGIALALAPDRRARPPDLSALDTWCVSQDGYRVDLDLDFRNSPVNALKLLPRVLTLPAVPAGAERPDLRRNALTWSRFSAPFAFAFSFQRLDAAELWIGETMEDLDLAFSVVSPHGAQNRQLIFRLAPRQQKDHPLLVALERGREVPPLELNVAKLAETTGPVRDYESLANPVLGAGPFRLAFQLEPRGDTTRVVVTMEKLPRGSNPARSYRLTAVLPGRDWCRGVPTLATESIQDFEFSLDRAVFRGELAEDFAVTEVPWQR